LQNFLMKVMARNSSFANDEDDDDDDDNNNNTLLLLFRSRGSIVGIVTSFGLEDRGVGVRVPVGSRIFCSPNRPDRLWGSPNLLTEG
jgi:hypothetical protein